MKPKPLSPLLISMNFYVSFEKIMTKLEVEILKQMALQQRVRKLLRLLLKGDPKILTSKETPVTSKNVKQKNEKTKTNALYGES